MKLRNRIRNFGDDIAAMFEHKHAVLTLEITRQKIQDNCLDKYFVVDMKLYSWITEQVDYEKKPSPHAGVEMQTYQSLIEDLEKNYVTKEVQKTFQ